MSPKKIATPTTDNPTTDQEDAVTELETLTTEPTTTPREIVVPANGKLTGRAAALARLARVNGEKKSGTKTRRTPSGEPKMKYHNDITEAQVAEMHEYLAKEERVPEVPYTVETARAKVQGLLRDCRSAYRADWIAKLKLEKAGVAMGFNFEGEAPEELRPEVEAFDEARKALESAQKAYLHFCVDLGETPGPTTGGTNPNDIRKELGMELVHRPVKAEAEAEAGTEAEVAAAE